MTKKLLFGDKPPTGNHPPGVTVYADLFGQVKALLLVERSYLNPKFKVEHLCARIKTTPASLLKALKLHGFRNFPNFINHFRVEEARKMMAQEEFQYYTLEAIAEMAGFGTRQAFYNTFERLTGMKPACYRRMVRRDILR